MPVAAGRPPTARYRVVSPGLFETLGIPLLAGRTFTADETRPGGEQVAVVSQRLAEAHFPGGALGRQIDTGGETYRIVGVVGDIRDLTLREPSPFPHVYVPASPATRQSMTLLLRSGAGTRTGVAEAEAEAGALLPPLRDLVRRLAPAQPVTPARPLVAFMSDSVARPRFTLLVLAFFASTTVLLSSLGLYGLLSWAVGRRTREIGVRLALGAVAGSVATAVVLQGMRLMALGTLLGLVLTLGTRRVLDSLLFEVEGGDPWVMAGVAGVLMLTAWVAAWVPARRATRVPPSEALRAD
jgi:predicted lysophospholipase L1 biosynthesis ABC-type transport system permease subunit